MSDVPKVRTADQVWDPHAKEWVAEEDAPFEETLYAGHDHSREAIASRDRYNYAKNREADQRALMGITDKTAYGHAFDEREMDQWRSDMNWAGEKRDVVVEILGEDQGADRRRWRDKKPHDPVEEILRDPDEVVADLVVASDYVFSVSHAAYASSASWSLSFASDPSKAVDLSGYVYPIGRWNYITTSDVRTWYIVDETATSRETSRPKKRVPPELNSRRHGKSAMCPRHGETKGGLCRKCR